MCKTSSTMINVCFSYIYDVGIFARSCVVPGRFLCGISFRKNTNMIGPAGL